MNHVQKFPHIAVYRSGSHGQVIAGLKLDSILKAELMSNRDAQTERKLDQAYRLASIHRFKARLDLLHALSSWPPQITFEFHITGLPDLLHVTQGNLMISLFIRSSFKEETEATALVASKFLALKPLMESFFPEMEFVPITDPNELSFRHQPFRPGHALSIERKEQTIVLEKVLKKLTLGFGPIKQKSEGPRTRLIHQYPWIQSASDVNRLLEVIIRQLDPVQLIFRFRPTSVGRKTPERLRKNISVCDDFLSSMDKSHTTLKIQAGAIRNVSIKQLSQLESACFNVGVFIVAPHPVDSSVAGIAGDVITETRPGKNPEDLFSGGFNVRPASCNHIMNNSYFPAKAPFTLSEATAAFILPTPPQEDVYGLPTRHFRTLSAAVPGLHLSRQGDTILFVNEHAGHRHPVKICAEDRMRHMFVLGQTGTGKSTLLEHLCLSDIRVGHGLAVIDPHGEMVDALIGKIPQNRIKDVILFDLLDKQRPIGFNLLEWKTIEERDRIIDELYLAIDRLYDMKQTGGPIFETNFRGMLKLLMGDRPRDGFVPTLLDFTSCYLSKKFRNWLLRSIDDLHVKDFKTELERTGGEASLVNLSPYITSKLSRFVSDTILRRIIGQAQNSIDFSAVMNEGKILLVKLGKGRFGSTVSGLITSQLVARLKLAAMKRAEMAPENRRDFFLYVDEAHNLPSDNFIELLAEARKYRMGMVLATQHTSQLINTALGGGNLMSAILGNVGTTIMFRLGQEDAFRLAPALYPQFNAVDIIGLPNWHGYARLQLNGQATPPFSFKTIKDDTPYDPQLASKVRTLSRLKFGNDCHMVDAQIRKARAIWEDSAGN